MDQDDKVLASVVRWIEVLASKPEIDSLDVICLEKGRHSLPDHVRVIEIGHGKSLRTLYRFYRAVFSSLRRGRVDFFFVHMAELHPILLAPFRYLAGIPIYHWKAHPHISWTMKIAARFCDTRIFTPTPHALPMKSDKISVVGHGVNIRKFSPIPGPKEVDIITVGRVMPSKRIDQMIEAIARCREIFGALYRMEVYGPTPDPDYLKRLEFQIREHRLQDQVQIRGPVVQDALPERLSKSRVFLNFSQTALDKAVLEAMACGVVPLSTNPCVADILPEEYIPLLIAKDNDTDEQAAKLHHLLSLEESERAAIGQKLREIVISDHSDERLFDRILREIQQNK